MIQIKKSHTHNMRNDVYFRYQTEFRDLILKNGADKLKVEVLFGTYLKLYERVKEAFERSAASIYTEKIREADKERDRIFTGLRAKNRASLKHFDPKIREAAERLKIVFDAHGNIARKPLNEQTSAVNKILKELTGKYSLEIEAVGICGWVEQLQLKNAEFAELMKKRNEETAAKSSVNMKKARTELDVVYRQIIERITALSAFGGYENCACVPPSKPIETILPYNPNEHFTQMKVGDLRQMPNGDVYRVKDLGQVHRPPDSEHGHWGWERVL